MVWRYLLPLGTGAGAERGGEEGEHVVAELVRVEDFLVRELGAGLAVKGLERDTFKVLDPTIIIYHYFDKCKNADLVTNNKGKRQIVIRFPCASGCES